MGLRSNAASWRALAADADRPEVQAEIRRLIQRGVVRVVPAPGGVIRIIPVGGVRPAPTRTGPWDPVPEGEGVPASSGSEA
jgi:hypothetical protein